MDLIRLKQEAVTNDDPYMDLVEIQAQSIIQTGPQNIYPIQLNHPLKSISLLSLILNSPVTPHHSQTTRLLITAYRSSSAVC